jgi:major membrane immunogen (membrane-anchored lipoprotein)
MAKSTRKQSTITLQVRLGLKIRINGGAILMKKRFSECVVIAGVAVALLSGCGSTSYADGTYTGQSSVYESDEDEGNGNGYGVVTITIKDNTITACEYTTYEPDGTLKDSDYGMQNGEVANRDYYNKAQKAIAACEKYASSLVSTNDLGKVDAISGATINYDNFKEAVKDALNKAKTK